MNPWRLLNVRCGCTQVGGPGNDFPDPVRSRAGRLRDEFQKNDNNDDFCAATSAAVVSLDAAGSNYMVAEQQPIAGASCMRSTNFDLYSTRSERVERFPAHGLKSNQ